jgi:hypothetical protein
MASLFTVNVEVRKIPGKGDFWRLVVNARR